MSRELQFIIYNTPHEDIKVNVFMRDETIWLTQKAMAELFNVERSVVTKHLGNIFKDGELEENSVCVNFTHTATDGKNYKTNFYNLDAIISVGYRVNSAKATHFKNIKKQSHGTQSRTNKLPENHRDKIKTFRKPKAGITRLAL